MGSRVGVEKFAARRAGLLLKEYQRRVACGLRRCWRCGDWLSLERFARDASRSQGRTGCCKPCMSIASKASRYGMTFEELRKRLTENGGRCPLCERASNNMVVDHCHDTGRVRGVICSGCNVGMGLLGDDPDLLRRAANYLEGTFNG
jgi:hypothetical protein